MNRREGNQRRSRGIGSLWSDVGRTWMKVGLDIGKVALETSVYTLQATSETLNRISKSADPNRERIMNEQKRSEPDSEYGSKQKFGTQDTTHTYSNEDPHQNGSTGSGSQVPD